MINAGNILVHEFIGLEAAVARCTDRSMEGQRGMVVDETKNTLVVETQAERGGARELVLPKTACVFRFSLPAGGTVDVDGRTVALDPVERAKRLAKACRWY